MIFLFFISIRTHPVDLIGWHESRDPHLSILLACPLEGAR